MEPVEYVPEQQTEEPETSDTSWYRYIAKELTLSGQWCGVRSCVWSVFWVTKSIGGSSYLALSERLASTTPPLKYLKNPNYMLAVSLFIVGLAIMGLVIAFSLKPNNSKRR